MSGRNEGPTPLHPAITATVVLTLLGLLAYNIIVVGPDGYPTSVVLGGLLGAYAGLRELVGRKRNGDGEGK